MSNTLPLASSLPLLVWRRQSRHLSIDLAGSDAECVYLLAAETQTPESPRYG